MIRAYSRSMVATLVVGTALSAGAATVDVTNNTGTISHQFLSSNGGLDSNNFVGSSANGVSVWLRARNRSSSLTPGPVPDANNTYTLLPETSTGTIFSIDFQFTPQVGDTNNYYLMLELDTNPSQSAESYANVLKPIFSTPTRTTDLWSSGDSYVVNGSTTRGTVATGIKAVQFINQSNVTATSSLPDYVIDNSWQDQWIAGHALGPGYYNIFFGAYKLDSNNQMSSTPTASVQATAHILPLHDSLRLALSLFALLGICAMVRLKLRQFAD